MKASLFVLALFVSTSAFAQSYEEIAEYEAGTERSEGVANDRAVRGIVTSLSRQPSLSCSLKTLAGQDGEKVLVGFFSKGGVTKFVVGIQCAGSDEMDSQKYDLVGIAGDGGKLIESLTKK